MKTQVVLAVMVAIFARQASSMPTYGVAHGSHHGSYVQPAYVGPLASSVPAGVDGRIIPVADTYEVAAARDQFFRAYQNQLDLIHSIRASRPAYHGTYGHAHPVHVSTGVHSHAVHAPHSHTTHVQHSVHAPAVHKSHIVHAPVVHQAHPVHAPAVHHVSHSSHTTGVHASHSSH